MTSLPLDTRGDRLMFVAGTLVHTPDGVIPIEQLRVGDLVISKSEDGMQRASRRVTAKQAQNGQEICLMRCALHSGSTFESLVFAGNRLIWTPQDWLPVNRLGAGEAIEVAGDPESIYICSLRLLQTDVPEVGWTHDATDSGPIVDLRGGGIVVSTFLEGDTPDPSSDGSYRYFVSRVYGIEVEEFHTYFVGEYGVWVHDGTLTRR